MYLRVREIFAMAADYAPTLPETTQFFRFTQNKLHFAATGMLDGAGRASRKQADAHAESQCEQFAARRRALLEAEGAEFNVRALEDAAKALPRADKKRK